MFGFEYNLKSGRTEFNEGLSLRIFRLKINTIIINEKTTIFFRNVCVKSYADNIHHAFVKYFEMQKSTYSLFLHKEIYRRTNSFFCFIQNMQFVVLILKDTFVPILVVLS